MIDGKIMTEVQPFEQLKAMIVGPEKNGKSRLAATGRKPILILDYDQRAEAVAGFPDVYCLTFRDPQWPRQPEVAAETVDIVNQLEINPDLSQLHVPGKSDLYFPNAKPETIVKTIVPDSIASMAKYQMAYALYNSPDLRRSLKIGPSLEIHLNRGWDGWNAEMNGIEAIILRLLSIKGAGGKLIDVIITLHETQEEAADSTEEKPKFTGKITVFPARYRRLLKYFTEVWRVKLTSVMVDGVGMRYIPRVYPLPDYAFDAATALRLDSVEEPDIAAMITKHERRVAGLSDAPQAVAVKAIPGIKTS